jgi:hypothetical protein
MIIFVYVTLVSLNFQQIFSEPRRVSFRDINSEQVSSQESHYKILVSITIQNNIFILPTFLGSIEQLDDTKYLSLSIVFQENNAEIRRMTNEWANNVKSLFNEINVSDDDDDDKVSISKTVQNSIERKFDFIFVSLEIKSHQKQGLFCIYLLVYYI